MKFQLNRALSKEKFAESYIPEYEVVGALYQTPLPPVARSTYYSYWCVVMNLIFGLLGLIILLAILPFMALLIYLDSPGPIFYTQERLGYKGATFRMYKLRSMHAERGDTALLRTAKLDTRVTRMGRFLRATHLDELPQVVNVLRGDMNLVGPRPEQPEIAALLEEAVPLYRKRLDVKPGLTGWAQVMYQYTNALQGDVVKLKHDLYYITNQSVQLDAIIILKTLVEVFSCRGR